MTDEFDDLLGEPTPPPADDIEERLKSSKLQGDIRRAGSGKTLIPENDFLMPVTMNFIARVMRMDPVTVKDRLTAGGCKPVGSVGAGRPIYLFHEAIAYVIKPRMNIGTYLKTLQSSDMPNAINKVFWEAERIKNKVLIETGEAWPTSRVLDVLGRVFMLIKDRMPLIKEDMREAGLTDEQNRALEERLDQFQLDLHADLVEMPKQNQTLSRRADIDVGEEPDLPALED